MLFGQNMWLFVHKLTNAGPTKAILEWDIRGSNCSNAYTTVPIFSNIRKAFDAIFCFFDRVARR